MVHRWLWLAVLLLAAGCRSGGGAETKALASWAASTDMLAEAWTAGSVPRAYTLRVLTRARAAIADEGRRLDGLPPETRAAAEAALARLGPLMTEMTSAIERDERARVAALRPRLAREAEALSRLAGPGQAGS